MGIDVDRIFAISYGIGLATEYSNGLRMVRSRPDKNLRKIAEETGGGSFELQKTDLLASTFTRVAQELRSQYLLGFTPEEADALLGEFTSLQPADAFRPDGTGLNLSEYHCTFLDTSYDYRAASARLIEHHFAEPLRGLLPEHRLLLSNLYVKQPGTGLSCCNGTINGVEGDCRPTRAYQKDDGVWYALLNGRWVPVPPRVVLQQLSPDGNSHICAGKSGVIFCFLGGSPKS